MRVERTGPVEPLSPRIEKFIVERLGGVLLDEIQGSEERRADYVCLRGLLAIEIKSLEDDGSERLDNLLEELRSKPDWPMFLGSAPMQSFIENTDDPETVGKQVLERVGRGILNPLKKANRQLKAHAKAFPRSSQVRVLILVNEDREIYDPETVAYVLWHAVRSKRGGKPSFSGLDGIVYFTERHATVIEGKVTFPVTLVEGPSVYTSQWKSDVLSIIQHRWGAWSYGKYFDAGDKPPDYATIDHIPESAPRHERWRTEYKRNPYLAELSKADLRDRFDEVTLVTSLMFLKNTPLELSQDEKTLWIRRFGDLTEEMGRQAIPITDFDYDPQRAYAAANRLGLPSSVVEFIEGLRA